MDVLAADAVGELRALGLPRPILLAETGAVEAHHAGPSKLYEQDRQGLLLHDQLFAPFFSGAAGPGHAWHWDFYVAKNDLWYHFGRFARAVAGIDPPAEQFEAQQIPHPRLRVYALLGQHTLLVWCRDSACDWHSELDLGLAPGPVRQAVLDLGAVSAGLAGEAEVYDPWTDVETRIPLQNGRAALPEFTRSLVVRISRNMDLETR